jgi:16S rRNA C1402 (ribose-2'-O) methylase RsmI
MVPGQCCAAGNPGSDRLFRGFLPGKTTPRDLYQTTVIAKLL